MFKIDASFLSLKSSDNTIKAAKAAFFDVSEPFTYSASVKLHSVCT